MKKLEVKEFNDIWYKNCFYNALIPVINSFHGEIKDYIVNDIAGEYKLHKSGKYTHLEYGTEIFKGIGLEELGITYESQKNCAHVTERIIQYINNDKLVIVSVDCFYEPIRKDTFYINHWPHVLLIYGYDDESFLIIESEYISDVRYKKMQIGKEDLEKCYISFNQYFNKGNLFDTLYAFSKANKWKKQCYFNMKKKIEEVLSYKERRIRSCDTILDYEKIIRHTDFTILDNQDEYIMGLNSVINNLMVEKYALDKFNLLADQNINILFEESIRIWKATRAILVKCVFTKKNDEKLISKAIDNLYTIKNNEIKRINMMNIILMKDMNYEI